MRPRTYQGFSDTLKHEKCSEAKGVSTPAGSQIQMFTIANNRICIQKDMYCWRSTPVGGQLHPSTPAIGAQGETGDERQEVEGRRQEIGDRRQEVGDVVRGNKEDTPTSLNVWNSRHILSRQPTISHFYIIPNTASHFGLLPSHQ